MSLLWWAGGEASEFAITTSGVVSNTNPVVHRSAYTRAAVLMPGVLTLGGVQAESAPLGSPITDGWWTARYWHTTAGFYGANPGIGMGNVAALVGGLYVGGGAHPNEGQLTLFSVDSLNVKTVLASEPGTTFATSALHRIDVQITGFNSVSGNVKVYLEGNFSPTLDYTGDLTGLGFSDLDCLRGLSTGDVSYMSELVIADEDTRIVLGVTGDSSGATPVTVLADQVSVAKLLAAVVVRDSAFDRLLASVAMTKIVGAAIVGADDHGLSLSKLLGSAVVSVPLRITTDCPIHLTHDEPIGGSAGFTFEAEGGTGVYLWDIRSGDLPPGLTFHADGSITGTPTTAGTYSLRVRVQSS